MSENEYVATAAAEKRLREVLADRMPGATPDSPQVDTLAVLLLDGAKIEYKARAKLVTISLELPDTTATRKPKAADPEPENVANASVPSDGYPDKQTYDEAQLARLYGGEPENVQAPPQPHIVPFAPVLDPDAEYEDVHYD